MDAWYLPDTAGITYRIDHGKTGVIMQMLDRENRRLGYFHNGGYYELEGEDFDGIFYLPEGRDMPEGRDPRILLPYVELVKLDRVRHDDEAVTLEAVLALTRHHLGLRPTSNPMARFGARLAERTSNGCRPGRRRLPPLRLRHLPAGGGHGRRWPPLSSTGSTAARRRGARKAADSFREIAATAKGLEFTLARAVRGRKVDLVTPFVQMADAWEVAMDTLVARYGS